MDRDSETFTSSYGIMREFNEIMKGVEGGIEDPSKPNVTDGWDPTPRDVPESLDPSKGGVPLGHIAFQGDFEQ